ncbi:hypothetical protein KUTeg_020694 [Tegillarca granosa]|uniref:Ninjurin-2 n=1 Tax=Tegillarca granosa TaxID=220873 RepID=A0ABQ9EDT8_TEGGR|nr:hypothetical protein KUTeg_020694 [Tegillarca granosa]
MVPFIQLPHSNFEIVSPLDNVMANQQGTVRTLYSKKKTVAEGLLDVGLIMANATQLKSLLSVGDSHRFFYVLLVIISLSILLQIAIGILLLYLGATEGKRETEVKSERMNNATLLLIFIVTLLNVFITAFGIELSSE